MNSSWILTVVLAAMFLTVHGSDAHQELLPSNVFQGTISIQALITAPFAAVFHPHGLTVIAVQLLHHAKVVILSTQTMDAALATVCGPHGKPVQVTFYPLHVMISTMSMTLRQIVLSAQISREALYRLAIQPPIIIPAPLVLIF